ncbi:S41 family peptidase [Streptomyces sp. NPDC050658]|uniref:S41 family peptidase n=1 Tax=Streptomyces sp. NPDC050658 TaxID=3365633 RepID=UPI0037ACC14B
MSSAPSVPAARTGGYLRDPQLRGDLLTFVAENDVWIAPLSGGRAWRCSAEQEPARHPRISPDGSLVAWTSRRTGAPEAVVAPVAGGAPVQVTHWANSRTRVLGWHSETELLVVSAVGERATRRTWARAVPLDGGPGRRLPYGPVSGVAHGPAGAVLVQTPSMFGEAAFWKRYRGGTTGRLWLDPDGSGEFRRIHEDLDGNIECPLWVGDRIAFLSDHDGTARLWSSLPDGSDPRRHTDHPFAPRNATTDGSRVVYQSGGELWLLPGLGHGQVPERLAVTLGSPGAARVPYTVTGDEGLEDFDTDRSGRAAVVTVRGTAHRVGGGGEPARALPREPGTRARLPRVLGETGRVACVVVVGGREAIEVVDAEPAPGGKAAVHRFGTGGPGRDCDLVASPGGVSRAAVTRDGRVLVAGAGSGEVTGVEHADGAEGTEVVEGAPVSGGKAAVHRFGTGGPGRECDLVASPGGVSRAAVTRDGRVLVAGAGSGEVTGVEHADGAEGTEVVEGAPVSGGKAAVHRFGTGRLGRVRELVASPDGTSLAMATHDGRVLVADAGSGELTEVDRTDGGEATDVVFSPDSRWLAWSHPGANRTRQIRLARLATGEVVEATRFRFSDRSPAFTADCLYVVFLSEREFDPVPQAHVLDPAFAAGTRLYALPLAADTPSPFSPHDPRRAEATGSVVVDREGLTERAEPFPVPAGELIDLRAADGGVLWIRKNPSGDWLAERGTLMRWDFAAGAVTQLRPDIDEYAVCGDGRRVLARRDRTLTFLPADRPVPGDAATGIPLEGARTRVDPAVEWAQAFDEDGELIRDVHARADLGGLDWDGVLDRYRPLVERLGCYDDFVDLLWEVHGELGCSHAYVTERTTTPPPPDQQGLLGADLTRDADGTWRVERIPRGDGAVAGARSALHAPGIGVQAGDALLEIDGVPTGPGPGRTPGALLAGKAGVPTRLTVGPADGGAPRSVTVVPLREEATLRYHAWVAERRELVARASDGRLGYLHVPDMLATGWAQFHRDLRTEFDRAGLVVDLRENTGGYLSELVVQTLARRILGWRVARGGSARSYPSLTPRGPVVVVTDEFTGSDGDVAAAAVKALGVGPVVGNRTWGGVNVMDWNFSLADGTGLILPREAYWFTDEGWQVENRGTVPDIEVRCGPEDHVRGRDRHLEEAVRVALDRLAGQPVAEPPAPW